jgi:hypothetical protein
LTAVPSLVLPPTVTPPAVPLVRTTVMVTVGLPSVTE